MLQTVIPVDDASALDALAKDVDLLEALDQELEGIQKENILAKLSNFRGDTVQDFSLFYASNVSIISLKVNRYDTDPPNAGS